MDRCYLVNFDSDYLPQAETELLIVGGGIAGLYTAWHAINAGIGVTLLTKRTMVDSNSDRAQGGIAVALGQSDSPQLHYADTIAAGAGLCDLTAVKVLVNEGPQRVQELISLGANFDRSGGRLSMTREGAHSQRRILHAQGDATGAEIMRTLMQQVKAQGAAEILEQHFVVDLLVADNQCYGVLALNEKTNQYHIFWARAVIMAAGGTGQLYKYTTNPEVATGDGIALGFRAGAEIMDSEFIQFHPTALAQAGAPRFLISEAVRGEGALLRNKQGERFMPRYHGLAELAPRDIVSRAILAEMAATASQCVYLDLSHLPAAQTQERFPTITSTCLTYGIDIANDLIPVAPAAHYIMGGIKTNINGATNLAGLYACGETSCLGVHGANRLASNSLLDGLVYGRRIVNALRQDIHQMPRGKNRFIASGLLTPTGDIDTITNELKEIMSKNVGPLRTKQRLCQALAFFERYHWLSQQWCRNSKEMELRNMLTVGQLITEAALMRTESRGGHFRLDFPETLPRWHKHIILRR